jgi:hypothetical protein
LEKSCSIKATKHLTPIKNKSDEAQKRLALIKN